MDDSGNIAIVTTEADMIDLVRSAIGMYAYKFLHIQDVESFWGDLEGAGLEDVVFIVDGRLDGAATFAEEVSGAGYPYQIVIVPYDAYKMLFSKIVGVTVLVQPVEVGEIQKIVLEYLPQPALAEAPAEALTPSSTEVSAGPEQRIEVEPAPAPPEPPSDILVELLRREEHHLYGEAVEAVHQFLHGHRYGNVSPIEPVSRIAESLAGELNRSPELCIETLQHVPDFGDADLYLASHHANVAVLAGRVGVGRKYPEDRLFEVILTALVHDVGMTQLPEDLITRQGKLSDSEYQEIRQHPLHGREILQHYTDEYGWLPQIVLQEHERHDGSGYPEGIDGYKMHEYAQVIGLVDTYDALTHVRPFRDQMLPSVAVQQLIRFSNQLFSGNVVKAFICGVGLYPVGSYVRLNTGEKGMVVGIDKRWPLRPTVMFFSDQNGEEEGETGVADLKVDPLRYISATQDHRV